MFLQIKVSTESFVANMACVRLVVVVRVHVKSEVVNLNI